MFRTKRRHHRWTSPNGKAPVAEAKKAAKVRFLAHRCLEGPSPLMPVHRFNFLPIALWPLLTVAAQADTATDAWKEVRPVLEKKCYECHGERKVKGGVDLKKLDADPQISHEFEI